MLPDRNRDRLKIMFMPPHSPGTFSSSIKWLSQIDATTLNPKARIEKLEFNSCVVHISVGKHVLAKKSIKALIPCGEPTYFIVERDEAHPEAWKRMTFPGTIKQSQSQIAEDEEYERL